MWGCCRGVVERLKLPKILNSVDVDVHVSGLGKGFLVCDRFNSLPQTPAVSVVLKTVLDFVSMGFFHRSDCFVDPGSCCSEGSCLQI